MTNDEYKKQAMFTCDKRGRSLVNAALGLTGEAGEVADLIKKSVYQGHPLEQDELINELGDVLWYITLFIEVLGIDLETIMQTNIDKLRKRYPNGFNYADSVNRTE